MTPIEILQGGKQKIIEPENWFQKIPPGHTDGKCHCMLTAIMAAGWPKSRDAYGKLIPAPPEYLTARETLQQVTGGDIVQFNDSHSHAECLAKFDEAIATLQTNAS